VELSNNYRKVSVKALKRCGKRYFHTHTHTHTPLNPVTPEGKTQAVSFLHQETTKAFPTETYSFRELGKLTITYSLHAKIDPRKAPFPLHIQGKEEIRKRTAQADGTTKGRGLQEPSLFHRTSNENTSQH